MRGLDLFSGIGGITLALKKWVKPVAYCEIDKYCQSVLLQRMSEGNLPKAPIWDDVRTLPIEELPSIDIIYGGFPCQDISVAGRQEGLEGERSGLFFEILRLLDKTKASFVFLENVSNIRTKGAERVCKELAERGYDCRWCNISARDVGARHKRNRWFLLANTMCKGLARFWERTECYKKTQSKPTNYNNVERKRIKDWQEDVANVCRTTDGVSHRVDRIKALGNSVVPLQVEIAFKQLIGD